MSKLKSCDMIAYETFSNLCAEQGVEIDDRIGDAVRRGLPSRTTNYSPTSMLIAITEAGHILRKDRKATIIDAPVYLSEAYADDIDITTLAGITNASLDHVKPTDPAMHFEYDKPITAISVCADAEINFARTLTSLFGLDKSGNRCGHQIITANDEPLFIRKNLGEQSALALKDFNVNGIPYPAGSLAKIGLRPDSYSSSLELLLSGKTATIVPIDSVNRMAFMRLSGFTFPPGQRAGFAEGIWGFSATDQKIAEQLTIDAIRKTIRLRMALYKAEHDNE